MALMAWTKLFVCLLPFSVCVAISPDGTCAKGDACKHDAVKQADINALFQSKTIQVLASETDKGDKVEELGAKLDDAKAAVLKLNDETAAAAKQKDADTAAAAKASIRPRKKKLMEMETTVKDILAMGKAAATPEFKTVIADLIAVVKDLQEKVKEDQTFAQSQVDAKIGGLTDATARAVDEKAIADGFDTSLDQCVTEEKLLLQEHEACKKHEGVLEDEKPSADYCGHPDFDIAYTEPPQLPQTLTVEFSKGLEHVQQQLQDYLVPLQGWIDAMKVKAESDQVKWDTADQRCKAKTKELADKKTECADRLTAWRAQHEKCLHADKEQEKSLCEFGHAYQAKCTAKTDFDNLQTDIMGTGTPFSEPDRKQEWRQTVRLVCVLEVIQSNTELASGETDTCIKSDDEAAAIFEEDVGSIDLKQTTYDSLTSPAKFTCAEPTVQFGNGVRWTWPKDTAAEIPKSTEYTNVAGYAFAIKANPHDAPFDFCLESGDHPTAPTCGHAFDCTAGSGSAKPATTPCHSYGGCSSADCCEGMFEAPAPARQTCPCVSKHLVQVDCEVETDGMTPAAGKCVKDKHGRDMPTEWAEYCGVHPEPYNEKCTNLTTGKPLPTGHPNRASWCDEEWCFIDPCTCKEAYDLPDLMAPFGEGQFAPRALFYSYANCGGLDDHNGFSQNGEDKARSELDEKRMEDVKQFCEADKSPPSGEKCPCVSKGLVEVNCTESFAIDGKCVLDKHGRFMPVTWAEFCGVHAEPYDDRCTDLTTGLPLKDPAPWCLDQWCFVDPCTCNAAFELTDLKAPFDEGQFAPVALFYSYENCKGTDRFSEANERSPLDDPRVKRVQDFCLADLTLDEADFNPSSPLVSYDSNDCGPRGGDAAADLSVCSHGSREVSKVSNVNHSVIATIVGCDYYAYTVYECLEA